eukprot:CAMPEP_0168567166 /NCGR_PEP_ID=MMETSP0413-20121227/14848_1 /TAXON_ID=136452 /ORGANISM="Filamoeba nolandi, Strain NC-AS-23-1" /LENGTH=413 /DNA_ID=CAMNT_0008599315 /DNA_START=169 /DNA_END=1407 /DNA_ORIENTATION=+
MDGILQVNNTYWPLKDKKWNIPIVPRDDEGFTQSFQADQPKEILQFFDDYGFVVVNDVVSKDETTKTILEIWNELEKSSNSVLATPAIDYYFQGLEYQRNNKPQLAQKMFNKAYKIDPQLQNNPPTERKQMKVDRNDPSTWVDALWPGPKRVGFSEVTVREQGWKNRENENIYNIFSLLLGRKDLWVSIDRYGIMRPTKNVPKGKIAPVECRTNVNVNNEEVEVEDKPEWRTNRAWTHWDLNPWKWTIDVENGRAYKYDNLISENNDSVNDGVPKLQGLLALADSKDEDGGFCAVPGFHKMLKEWATLTTDTEYYEKSKSIFEIFYLPKEDPLHHELQKVTMRAGSLLIWRGELPHCNFPNESTNLRINQYIKMFPAQEGAPGTKQRLADLKQLLHGHQPGELGRKLYGMDSW